MIGRVATAFLISFALFAPWSIAMTQVSFGLLALSGLLLWVATRRGDDAGNDKSGSDSASANDSARPNGSGRFEIPWTLRLILVFLGVQALSIVFSIDSGHALKSFRGSWTYLFPFVLYPLLLRDGATQRTLQTLVVSGGIAGAYALFQAFTGMSPLDGEDLEARSSFYMASGTLGHHLTFAGVLLPLSLVAIGKAVAQPRLLWIACATTSSLGLFLSFSRLGWIGFAAGALVLAASLGKRFLFAALGSITALVVAAVTLSPAIAARLSSIADLTELPRFRLWQSAVEVARNYPVIGGGLGSWGPLFEKHKVAGEYYSTNHPHNDLLNVIVETGLIGGLAWVAIWVCFFWETRAIGAGPKGGNAIVLRALRAAVAALLVGGLAQCLATDEEVAQHWMLLISLALALAFAIRRESVDRAGAD